MKPGLLDVVCPQGATYSVNYQWLIDDVGVDLTSYTAAMQVRASYNAAEPLIDLASPADITLDDSGNIGVTIAADVTGAVPAGTYVWDIELTTGTTVYRLLQGRWMHTAEVTRGD